MAVQFAFTFRKAQAVLLYLANGNLSEFTKGKACKLVFLADKHHLVRHARIITGDSYAALPHGPVPSRLLQILDEVELGPTSLEAVELSGALNLDRRFQYPRLQATRPPDLALLSESDLESVRWVVDKFGAMTFTQLRALTHEIPAYDRAWEARDAGSNKGRMSFEEFFEEDGEARAGVREEMLENDALRNAFPDPAWF